jgi:hypothetical protein
MDKAQAAWHYFQLIAPWLVVSFIPSLITGLSAYPKAAGVVSALRKVLQVLSFVTHADQAGTFKLPLTMVPAPGGGK